MLNFLHEHYEVEVDWVENKYCDISIGWDYEKWKVHLYMKKDVQKTLKRLQHEALVHPQYSPHSTRYPTMGKQNSMPRRPTPPAP